jgi:hypothetical protein
MKVATVSQSVFLSSEIEQQILFVEHANTLNTLDCTSCWMRLPLSQKLRRWITSLPFIPPKRERERVRERERDLILCFRRQRQYLLHITIEFWDRDHCENYKVWLCHEIAFSKTDSWESLETPAIFSKSNLRVKFYITVNPFVSWSCTQRKSRRSQFCMMKQRLNRSLTLFILEEEWETLWSHLLLLTLNEDLDALYDVR